MLATFESMFDDTPMILERATDYWESGRVHDVQEIAPQLFHARISGNEDAPYDVDIRLNHTDSKTDSDHIRVQSAACTCPYERTPYCKHIGAMLYELRKRLITDIMPNCDDSKNNTDTSESQSHKTALPHMLLDSIQQSLSNREEQINGQLLFMWSDHRIEVAQSFRSDPESSQPLMSLDEAETMIFNAVHHYNDQASYRTSRTANDAGFREFIEAIQITAINAMQSTDYADACVNLRLCVHAVCAFTITVDDDNLSPLLKLMDSLIIRICCYMENVAAYADSSIAGKALDIIMQAARDRDLRYCDPLNSMLLTSSALAYARFDDKRMWAYDTLEYELDHVDGESRINTGPDYTTDTTDDNQAREDVISMFTQMIAYDLYVLSDDESGRQHLLDEHPDSHVLMMIAAAQFIHDGFFHSAYTIARRFLDYSREEQEADLDVSHNGLLPNLLPHGWHSIMECCAEGLNDITMLASIYRYYIMTCNDKSDVRYVSKLQSGSSDFGV